MEDNNTSGNSEYLTRPEHKLVDLRENLLAMGIKPSDKILVHSSLKAIGPIEGGADGLISLLTSVLDKGALQMPAHTWQQVGKETMRFLHETMPTCVGVLSERFRLSSGVIRSAHPTHSNSGWGVGIRDMLAGQEKFDTPCAPESTYGRLGEEGYKIFLLGVDFGRNTAVHGLEEKAEVPGRLTEDRQALEVEFADGTVVSSPQHRHMGVGSDRYVRVQPMLEEAGILRRGLLGYAQVLYMDAAPMFDRVVDLLRRDPSFFTRDEV